MSQRKDCTFDVTDKIKLFLTRGWETTTESYGKSAKDRPVSPDANDTDLALMKLLGATREYIVQKSFACNKTSPAQQIVVSGSTNPTSDYDATLIGSGACDTMWAMFDDFARTYGTSLAQALDVNLYTTGLYLLEPDTLSTRDLKARRLDFGRTWTLTPCNSKQRSSMEVFASVKLIECGYRGKALNAGVAVASGLVLKRMNIVLDIAINVARAYKYDTLAAQASMPKPSQTALGAESKLRRVTDWAMKNNEFVKLVAKYALQHYFGSMFNERTNRDYVPIRTEFQQALAQALEHVVDPRMDIMDLLSHVRFFSVEGAYTQGTVNAVVIIGQLGNDMKLDPCDHVCSMIENYADFVKHSAMVADMEPVHFALKFSKYVVRMLDAAIALGYDEFAVMRDRFVERVYKLRAAGEASNDVLCKELYMTSRPRGKFTGIADLVAGVTALFEQLRAPRFNNASRAELFKDAGDSGGVYDNFVGGAKKTRSKPATPGAA